MFTELVKHLSESDGTSWQSKDMNKARRRWESGEMSSQIFFGELIQAVFTSDHVISSLNLKVYVKECKILQFWQDLINLV